MEKLILSARIPQPMYEKYQILKEDGYTNSEIVREGIRLLARREIKK